MRLKVKKEFFIQVNSQKVRRIAPGVYSIPEDIDQNTADKIRRWGRAEAERLGIGDDERCAVVGGSARVEDRSGRDTRQ